MDCGRLAGLVAGAALGEIEPAELGQLRSHISGCASCRHYLVSLRRVLRLVDCALLGLPSQAGLPHWADHLLNRTA